MGKYNTRHAAKRIHRNAGLAKEGLLNIPGDDDELSTNIENNRKRKPTKVQMENEKETKRIKKTDNLHDNYCWKCHKIEAEIECSTCPRSFHTSCAKSAKINENGSCNTCQEQSMAKATSNADDENHLSKLLLHIIDTACPMDTMEFKSIVDWPNREDNAKLICKRDFTLIHDRCIGRGIQYESPEEMINDVKWILHNCIIIFGDKSAIVKSTDKVLKAITSEVKDASDCLECYYKKVENESLFLLNICKTPHPLVWAKQKSHPYWPAKCLKVANGKAHVRYFYTHQRAYVPMSNAKLSDVLAMSKDCPSSITKKNSNDFILAKSELKAYIDLFENQYGDYPYEDAGISFDFNKQENILMDLFENSSRKRIVSEDTFRSVSDSESRSSLPVVDLTDDGSEDDEDQIHENDTLSVHDSPIHDAPSILDAPLQDAPPIQDPTPISVAASIHGNLFQDQAHTAEVEHDFLEKTNISAPEVNNTYNDQSLMDTINNDSMIKAGFQNSVDVLQGNPKELLSMQHAISGSLLPSQNSEDSPISKWLNPRLPSPSGISISNVISGTDVPSDSGTEHLVELANCEADPVIENNFVMGIPSAEPNPFQSTSVYSHHPVASTSSMQLCLRNFDRASEAGDYCSYPANSYPVDADIQIIDEVSPTNPRPHLSNRDTECILQTILRHDPKFYTVLKQANFLVQQLFIQFWGTATKLKKPEKVIQSQECEIRALKSQLDEIGKQILLLKDNYEEKIRNADQILKSLKVELYKQSEKLKEEKEKHAQDIKLLSEINEKQSEELKKLNENYQSVFNSMNAAEAKYKERLREAKTIKYCDNVKCYQRARNAYWCCYSGMNSFAYCSDLCKSEDVAHKRICKAGKISSISQSEDKEAAASATCSGVEVFQKSCTTVSTLRYITHTSNNKEIASSSTPQPTIGANLHKVNKKVISSKQASYEVAKNLNRNQNSPDIY